VNRFKVQQRHEELTAEIERLEARVAAIEADFARSDYYEVTAPTDMTAHQQERTELQARLEHLVEEWAEVESTLAALES